VRGGDAAWRPTGVWRISRAKIHTCECIEEILFGVLVEGVEVLSDGAREQDGI